MKTSERIDSIAKALVESQKEITVAIKDSKNPYFKSNYADLTAVIEAVKEPLNKHGIAFLQLVHSNEKDVVETILIHESGQFIATETRVYCSKPNDPQAFGSGITYTKRYALQAALGLPTEDDDGNAASDKKTEPQAAQVAKPAFKKTDKPAPETSRKSNASVELKKIQSETPMPKESIDLMGGIYDVMKNVIPDKHALAVEVYHLMDGWPTDAEKAQWVTEQLQSLYKEVA